MSQNPPPEATADGLARSPEAPPAVQWITRTLEDAGFETWTVGGAVRDVFFGLDSGDWDLATRARPDEMRRLFRRTVPIGIEHGTVGVLAKDGTLYEVTTFRRDVVTSGRHAIVEFAESLEEDLSRRDFTINAIAWHPLRRVLFDPFGGIADIGALVLRTVGRPEGRFREDYLRVLRALRFAGRFGLEVDPATWTALVESTDRLDSLSRERVRDELMKVLGGDPRPSRSLELYRTSGVLAATAPELAALVDVPLPGGPAALDAWRYGVALAEAVSQRDPVLRLLALCQGIGLPAGAAPAECAAGLLIRLRFSNAQIERVSAALRAGPVPPSELAGGAALRRWLSRVGPDSLPDLARVWVARERVLQRYGEAGACATPALWKALRAELRRNPPLSVGDLALNGRDLVRMGMRPGPRFGAILLDLLDVVLEDPALNETEILAAQARRIWATYESNEDVPGEGNR